ncbi:MAG: hypothetical protein MJA84_09300 [Firmicutes bacterium]|nr:hypothetical protein [Bacillota bacterium]
MKRLKIISLTIISGLLVFAAFLYNFVYSPFDTNFTDRRTGEPPAMEKLQINVPDGISETGKNDDLKGDTETVPLEPQNHPDSINRENAEKQWDNDRVTVNDIEEWYRPQLTALGREYEARLNVITAQGISEYMSYKETGREPPVVHMAKKYMDAGSALEKECDARFYSLVALMERDLRKAGLPQELADKARREYKDLKAERKKQLIRNGLEFVGL